MCHTPRERPYYPAYLVCQLHHMLQTHSARRLRPSGTVLTPGPTDGEGGTGQPDPPVPASEDTGLQTDEGGSWLRRSPGKALMSMTACCPVWLLMMMSIPKSDTPSACRRARDSSRMTSSLGLSNTPSILSSCAHTHAHRHTHRSQVRPQVGWCNTIPHTETPLRCPKSWPSPLEGGRTDPW